MAAEHHFKKGQSGNPNGRPKGSTNKIKYDVAAILEKFGCNPINELAKLATKAKSEKVRCDAASELLQYVAPKLKAVDLSVTDEAINLVINLIKNKANEDVG